MEEQYIVEDRVRPQFATEERYLADGSVRHQFVAEEPCIVEDSLPPQTAEQHLEYLIQHAVRCHMIARGSDDSDFTRSIVALGQEYAAQALIRGADPRSVPDPGEWRSITDNLDRPYWP